MKTTAIAMYISLALSVVFTPVAYAVNLSSVTHISDSAKKYYGHAGYKYTAFEITWRANDKGVHHLCEVLWTPNGWYSYDTIRANFQYFSGTSEIWKASGSISGHVDTIEYVFRCTDLDVSVRESLSNNLNRLTYGLTIQSPVTVINSQ